MRPKKQGGMIKAEGQRCSGIMSSDSCERMFDMRAIHYRLGDIEILTTDAWNSSSK
jgi:hypothetical protein